MDTRQQATERAEALYPTPTVALTGLVGDADIRQEFRRRAYVEGALSREGELQALRNRVVALEVALRETELFVRVLGLDSEPAKKASDIARALLAQPTTP